MRNKPIMKVLVGFGILAAAACGGTEDDAAALEDTAVENATFMAALSEGESEDLADVPTGDAGDAAEESVDDAEGEQPTVFGDCSLAAVRARLVAQYDGNGNGQLDPDERAEIAAEFGASVERPRQARHRRFMRRHRFARLRWIYDADGTGVLSDAQRQALRNDLEQRCLARQEQLIELFDANEDGTLDEDELAAARAARRARWENRRDEVLERFDENEDGVLDATERAAAREALRTRVQQRRAALKELFDVDDDGTLSAAEKAALREHLRARVRGEHFGQA